MPPKNKMKPAHKPRFVFFGTPDIAVTALAEMAELGQVPDLVVTNPDAPVGRKQVLTAPPVKVWAMNRDIPVLQPTRLSHPEELSALTDTTWDFFTVFAYGKLIPSWLLDLPTYATINAHPSLLPKFRGASPIQSTLLHDLSAAGVSIIKMDEAMDHGPILYQQAVSLEMPIPADQLSVTMGRISGDLLAHVMLEYPKGTLTPTQQDHSAATFCSKISKDMAELAIDPHALPTGPAAAELYRKICAFTGWPGSFFTYNNTRIKINEASLNTSGSLHIHSVTPAGKKPQLFTQWLQNQSVTPD